MDLILLPISVRKGVLEQGFVIGFRDCIASLGQFDGLEVVGRAEPLEIRHQDDIRELALLAFCPFDCYGERASHNAQNGVEIAFRNRREGKRDGKYDVGVHVMNGAGGKVQEYATIDIFVALHLKRLIDTGKRDRGAYGVRD